jgi:hypothetical protein
MANTFMRQGNLPIKSKTEKLIKNAHMPCLRIVSRRFTEIEKMQISAVCKNTF